MKCVCGYEGEDFIILEKLRVMQISTTIDEVKTLYTTDDFEWVYACPKCNTLKIEVSK